MLLLMYKAAKCYRLADFNHVISQIRRFDGGKVYNYLQEAGFEKWARAYFPGHRYNVMTTNIAECINVVLRDARSLSITKLMKHLVQLIQRWFNERRNKAILMTNNLTDHYETIAKARSNKCSRMMVHPISLNEFHVTDGDIGGQVDLANKTCSCRVFQIDHMPCSHAYAACQFRNVSTTPLWSRYYTTEMLVLAYAEPIYPIVSTDNCDNIRMETTILLPPTTRRPGGRPRKRRLLSAGETSIPRLCSRCKRTGHNRQTCKEAISLHPSTSTQLFEVDMPLHFQRLLKGMLAEAQ